MAFKITDAKKWNDKRFRELSKNEKILYVYIWDMCDMAGFFKLDDIDRDCFVTGFSSLEFEQALDGLTTPKKGVGNTLSRGFIRLDGYVWISHYIKHNQTDFGRTKNNAHKAIYKILGDQRKFLHEHEYYSFIQTLQDWDGVWSMPDVEPTKPTIVVKRKITADEPVMSRRIHSPEYLEAVQEWKTHYYQKTKTVLHSASEINMLRMLRETFPQEEDQIAAIHHAMSCNWTKINPHLYQQYLNELSDKKKHTGSEARINKMEDEHSTLTANAKTWKQELTK